ncbi:acyl carrier protein [Aerococcaceae bacterium zg-ZJ1578]|uniref:acyl carrier protein n=1 Tax=Aerococcaceae TaxID=186827 RepID=UPI0013BD4DCD|nr:MULTISPECIES: acyl carrier protein [unclassified Facklamia]MBK0348145.1 acyl carrier protein [Aerococcaceae bacterium zg-1578]MBS4461438.1 acyl carrier protein [Aerococcaceae bacterium zg-B36]QQD65796.1 acyl carrier protein [Aerococcaceae bacterium zg-252]NEW64089.1 acyl carrier protein [Facklamia sp. 252]NEW67547.1 acyl carrier protein [Facklamia sp. 253]
MSETETVFSIVKNMIVDRFNVNEETVTPTMTFDDLGADSLDVVELVMEIENHFDVTFDDEKIEQLTNIGDAVQYIETLKEA